MNFDDEHAVIVDLKKRAGGSMADLVSDDQIAAELVYLSPDQRAEVLLKTEAWLGDESGADLRKRAQLLTLARQMRDLDLTMRKVGR